MPSVILTKLSHFCPGDGTSRSSGHGWWSSWRFPISGDLWSQSINNEVFIVSVPKLSGNWKSPRSSDCFHSPVEIGNHHDRHLSCALDADSIIWSEIIRFRKDIGRHSRYRISFLVSIYDADPDSARIALRLPGTAPIRSGLTVQTCWKLSESSQQSQLRAAPPCTTCAERKRDNLNLRGTWWERVFLSGGRPSFTVSSWLVKHQVVKAFVSWIQAHYKLSLGRSQLFVVIQLKVKTLSCITT